MATKKAATKKAATKTPAKKTAAKKTGGESAETIAETTAPMTTDQSAKAPSKGAKAAGGRVDLEAGSGTSRPVPTHGEIATLAHRYWQERGGHHGSHVGDWLRAEKELRGE